jgi:H+/Cl- antiporter ClcA
MKKLYLLLLAAIIGVADALILKGFEFVTTEGSLYVWNDIFKTDVYRWGVIPLAIVLSIVLGFVLRWTNQERLVKPKLSPVDKEPNAGPPTLKTLGIITIVGIVSLLAGASLGPEASLVAITGGLGTWVALRTKNEKAAPLMELASIGGLLVAFVSSLFLLLIPILMLWQKKQLKIATALPVLIAGSTSFITLLIMDPSANTFGELAWPHFPLSEIALALALGFTTAGLGWLLKKFISRVHGTATKFQSKLSWPVTAGIFGSIIGVLYFIGGPTIQFSGSVGTQQLVTAAPTYTLTILIIILFTKLLVTGWSLATGYRGGLVFPSIFVGVSIALIAERLTGITNTGVMVGAIAGVLAAMTGPAMGFIFVMAILPFTMVFVALAGTVGAVAGNKLLSKLNLD